MNTYGYLRVSTFEQDNDKFQSEILKYANSNKLGTVMFIEEKISGTKDYKKRELGNLIFNICKSGDFIIVSELSRISRSITQIYEIISVCQEKNITLHFIKQNLTIRKDNDITTRVMLSTFSLIAEMEREFISIRTKEALYEKKRQGIKLGRRIGSTSKSKLDKYKEEIIALRNNGSTLHWIAQHYNCSTVTVSNYMKKNCIQ